MPDANNIGHFSYMDIHLLTTITPDTFMIIIKSMGSNLITDKNHCQHFPKNKEIYKDLFTVKKLTQ